MNSVKFENGAAVSGVLAKLHETLPSAERQNIGPVTSTAYFDWLNAPSEKYAQSPPPITNLAAFIYDQRVDLQKAFPKLEGWTRIAFIQWYLIHAQREYGLDNRFIAPIQHSVLDWAVDRTPDDPLGDKGVPLVTNLGAYRYATETKLRQRWPDIYGENRVDFAVWYLYNADLERCERRDLILPVVQSWARACINNK